MSIGLEQNYSADTTPEVSDVVTPQMLHELYTDDCQEIATSVLNRKKSEPMPSLQDTLHCFESHPLYTLLGAENFAVAYEKTPKKVWENYMAAARIQEFLDGSYGTIEQRISFLQQMFSLNNSSFNSFVTSESGRFNSLMNTIFSSERVTHNFLVVRENMRNIKQYQNFRTDILGSMDPVYGKDSYNDDEFKALLKVIE